MTSWIICFRNMCRIRYLMYVYIHTYSYYPRHQLNRDRMNIKHIQSVFVRCADLQ